MKKLFVLLLMLVSLISCNTNTELEKEVMEKTKEIVKYPNTYQPINFEFAWLKWKDKDTSFYIIHNFKSENKLGVMVNSRVTYWINSSKTKIDTNWHPKISKYRSID